MARLFTVSEVQGLIPLLELLFGRLLVGREQRNRLVAQIEVAPLEKKVALEAELGTVTAGLRELAARIAGVGGEVKDFERGLVDFPCQRGSQTVLLCWQYGEKRLAYWHTPEDGFPGRKPIADDEERSGVLLN